jgi:hypothetical protein
MNRRRLYGSHAWSADRRSWGLPFDAGSGALNLTTGPAYALLGAMPMVMITGQKGVPAQAGSLSGLGYRLDDDTADL